MASKDKLLAAFDSAPDAKLMKAFDAAPDAVVTTKTYHAKPPIEADPEQVKPDFSPDDAEAWGQLNGVSFGLTPYVGGALNAIGSKMSGAPGTMAENYRAERDSTKRFLNKAEEAAPLRYLRGNLTGGAVMPMPGGGAVSGAGKLLTSAGQGAAMGAIGGDHDLFKDPKGVLDDAVMGMGLGAAGHYVGQGLGAIGRAVVPENLASKGQKLKEMAEWLAVSAMRPFKTHTDELVDKSLTGPLGRDMLDNGMVKAFDNNDNIMERLIPEGEKRNSRLNDVLEWLGMKQKENAGPYPNMVREGGVVPQIGDMAGSEVRQTINPLKAGTLKTSANRVAQASTMPPAVGIGPRAPRDVPLGDMREMRHAQGELAYATGGNGKGGTASTMRDAYNVLTNGLKDSADEIASAHAPDLVGAARKADKAVYLNTLAQEIGGNRKAADQANRLASVSDHYAAGTGMLVPGDKASALEKVGGGFVAGLVNNQLRTRGASTSAVVSDALGNALKSKPAEMMSKAGSKFLEYLPAEGSSQGVKAMSSFQEYLDGTETPSPEHSSAFFVNKSRSQN